MKAHYQLNNEGSYNNDKPYQSISKEGLFYGINLIMLNQSFSKIEMTYIQS